MRPAGEVRQALLKSAHALHSPDKAPTLQELAAHACVGLDAANTTVRNLCRAGKLVIARERRVTYRNRPVAEYAPAV